MEETLVTQRREGCPRVNNQMTLGVHHTHNARREAPIMAQDQAEITVLAMSLLVALLPPKRLSSLHYYSVLRFLLLVVLQLLLLFLWSLLLFPGAFVDDRTIYSGECTIQTFVCST